MVNKKQLEEQIKDLKEAMRNYEEDKPMSNCSEEYAGNPYFTLGWMKSIITRYDRME